MINKHYLTLILLISFYCNMKANTLDLKNIDISLGIENSKVIVDTINDIPIIPMGFDIIFITKVKNSGNKNIFIEEPKTSQNSLAHHLHSEYTKNSKYNTEGTLFLNPAEQKIIDSIKNYSLFVAPRSDTIMLKPGEISKFKFSLFEYILDRSLIPGIIEISTSYFEKRSNVFKFKIEFRNESIDKLIKILENEKLDMWSRREAYKWIKKGKPDFNYSFNESSK